MKERLEKFLSYEQLSQAQFADAIHVARAGISHIMAGRNKPGFEFINNTMEAFPELNIEWLLRGTGEMIKPDAPLSCPNAGPSTTVTAQAKVPGDKKRQISRLVVFYDDGTFTEIL